MNPSAIEAVQMIQDSLPTVAATAPIENSTSGGTPLATQNAPVQSIPRWSPSGLSMLAAAASFTAALMRHFPRGTGREKACDRPYRKVLEDAVVSQCLILGLIAKYRVVSSFLHRA